MRHIHICALGLGNHHAVAVDLDDIGWAFVLADNLAGKRLVTGLQAEFVLQSQLKRAALLAFNLRPDRAEVPGAI